MEQLERALASEVFCTENQRANIDFEDVGFAWRVGLEVERERQPGFAGLVLGW